MEIGDAHQAGDDACHEATSVTHDPMSDTPPLAVTCDSDRPGTIARADALALRLQLPQHRAATDASALQLVVTDERIELRLSGSTVGPVYCEFTTGRFGYRKTLPLRHELIARAIGFSGVPLDVIDMTAGLGRDAMLLTLLGCRVTAIEAHPVVFELLADGLRRAAHDEATGRAIEQRLRLIHGDAVEALAAWPVDAPPDVVYLDPMFPPRRQSALMKKEMLMLARLVGQTDDAVRLLSAAFRTGCHRVVVKRPRHAPSLVAPGGPPASLRVEGRAARFDVYFPSGLAADDSRRSGDREPSVTSEAAHERQ